MISPNSESYPYLAYAQRFNLDYGLVLTCADYWEYNFPDRTPEKLFGMHASHQIAIRTIVNREGMRRQKIRYAESIK